MISRYQIIFLFLASILFVVIFSNCQSATNKLSVDENLKTTATDLMLTQNLSDIKSKTLPSYPFRIVYAKKEGNNLSLFAQTESGIANYILNIKIAEGKMETQLHLGSDSLSGQFRLEHQQLVLNKTTYEVGETLHGQLSIKAFNENLKEAVEIKGDLNLKIKTTEYDVSKARAAKRLERFYNIAKVRPEEVTSLDLTNLDLTELPYELTLFKNLERLELAYNQLDHKAFMPLCQMSNLKFLSLSKNNIEIIPPEINCLLNLEELNLQNNQIAKIPQAFDYLQKLEMLNLQFNEIEAIPSSLVSMAALKVLLLTGNPIKEFPIEIIELEKLEEIHLPDSLAFLQNKTIKNTLNNTKYKYHGLKEDHGMRLFLEK